MKFNLTKPCKNCPFRNDIKPFLSKRRVKEIEFALVNDDKTFSCHKTVNYETWENYEEDYIPNSEESHCAGALILLEKNNLAIKNNMLRIAERLGLYDYSKLDLNSPVYKNFSEMIKVQDY